MNILLTGGTGYIGSHTVLQLRERGEHVVVLDDLSTTMVEVGPALEALGNVSPDLRRLLDNAGEDGVRSMSPALDPARRELTAL